MSKPTTPVATVSPLPCLAPHILAGRVQTATDKYHKRVSKAVSEFQDGPTPADLLALWQDAAAYALDAAQRTVLFWETLRQRGNQWLAHERAGKPPVLHFDHEMVLDARSFERPANYALLRIVPPPGTTVDPWRRPYVIIDPRAGHGPGIGGFKDVSQVGVALAGGHPVYFVMFFPEPMPGQTLLDVTQAEREFLRKVRELHPDSAKPAVVGNCQGGWAAMMLAATDPDMTGPLVINGAPMSYWGGAWTDGAGDNPMRYSGGLLGGSWLASLTADLSNGSFDGAWLVQNFESLNPANTFFGRYYHLFANVDTEPPRFLEFERWWGGFYLLNREEIEWITQNLFVGNRLWKGDVASAPGKVFDLREIKSPIILFASMGDNITPPQQAFNWVADVYGSTDEIKARGQVIVGLLHEDVGHLGIFVSGSVARREHRQIVSVLKSIEALPAGLYGMQIHERRGDDGRVDFEVEFVEHRLEDIALRLNRLRRADERPFEAVAQVSEFNQRAYELFGRPLVQSMVQSFGSEASARLGRLMHPLRAERWSVSDLNPWLWWLEPAARSVKVQRRPVGREQPFARAESLAAALISAGWDCFRDLRDAASEAAFFHLYGGLLGLRDARSGSAEAAAAANGDAQRRHDVLARATQGGFPAAVARTAFLLSGRGVPLPLEQIETKAALMRDYRALMPDVPPDEMRRVRGEQEILVGLDPASAIETLPALLVDADDRQRYFALFDRLLSDPRLQAAQVTQRQRAMLDELRRLAERELMPDAPGATPARRPAGRRGGRVPDARKPA
jgi:pimeloyl-ACP methyl ester carboxylesterase